MKVLKNFNDISSQLKAEIPQLKKGEIRVFRMLTGIENPDPDPNEKAKRPVLYGGTQIPCQDRIKDQYSGKYIDIGVVEQFDLTTERPTHFRLFIPGQGSGMFTLRGGNIEDEELFEYLWICNFNGRNPYRDDKNPPLFEEVIFADENEVLDEKIDALTNALLEVKSLTTSQVTSIAAELRTTDILFKNSVFNISDEKILHIRLKQYAQTNPVKFLEAFDKVAKKKAGRPPKEVQPVQNEP